MKTFKQYTTESSLGAAKQWRAADPKASTNKLVKRLRRIKLMDKRDQVRGVQATTRAFQSKNPKVVAKENRRANALRKQRQVMKNRLGGFAFTTMRPLSDKDVDRAIDLETDNKRSMSSSMRGKGR
mgnify:CR=1 FL=1